jgi:hypothetical protein
LRVENRCLNAFMRLHTHLRKRLGAQSDSFIFVFFSYCMDVSTRFCTDYDYPIQQPPSFSISLLPFFCPHSKLTFPLAMMTGSQRPSLMTSDENPPPHLRPLEPYRQKLHATSGCQSSDVFPRENRLTSSGCPSFRSM